MAEIAQLKCRALNYLLAVYCTIYCTHYTLIHSTQYTHTVPTNTNIYKYIQFHEIHSGWIKVCNMALFNPSNPNKENKLYRHNFTIFIFQCSVNFYPQCCYFSSPFFFYFRFSFHFSVSFYFYNCTFSARILFSIIDSIPICTRLS